MAGNSASQVAVGNPVNRPLQVYFHTMDFVKVHSGPDREFWVLPRELLYAKIPFLRSLLSGAPDGKQKSSAYFRDVEPAVLSIVVNWILTGQIRCREGHNVQNPLANENDSHLALWFSLLDFSQGFNIQELMSAANTRMIYCITKGNWLPSRADIIWVFGKTSESSEIRAAMVGKVCRAFTSSKFPGSIEDLLGLAECQMEFGRNVSEALEYLGYHGKLPRMIEYANEAQTRKGNHISTESRGVTMTTIPYPNPTTKRKLEDMVNPSHHGAAPKQREVIDLTGDNTPERESGNRAHAVPSGPEAYATPTSFI